MKNYFFYNFINKSMEYFKINSNTKLWNSFKIN